ncbi:MAG: YARHG domain-containing protein [Bacteroidales bacterium]|nr:YARHG domain-containing protein [Bacteroidales bacterium]
MKRLIIVISLIGIFNNLIDAQNNYEKLINPTEIGRVNFVGTVMSKLIFQEDDTWDLYELIENPDNVNGQYYYKLYKKGNINYDENNTRKTISYIKDDCIIYFKVIRSLSKPYTYKNEVYLEYPDGKVFLAPHQLFDYNINDEKDFLVFTKDDIDSKHPEYKDGFYITQKIWYVDLKEENPESKQLSIRGRGLKIISEYLYFYDYYNKDAYDEMFNLYRVKLQDWNNVEMILRQTYSRGYIYPNHKLLFASIVIDHKPVNIIYNTETQSYARLDENSIYNTGHIVKNTSSTGGASYYSEKYDAAFWKGRTHLNYISNLPKEYPHKFREIRGVLKDGTNGIHYQGYESFDDLPKKVDLSLPIEEKERLYNFPRPDKLFNGTFITNELMYEASKENLGKLTRDELRLLRNAFFARLGYKFKSEDLQNFFGQFDWYNNSEDKLKLPNEKIIIPDEDKKRIDLIQEVENSK